MTVHNPTGQRPLANPERNTRLANIARRTYQHRCSAALAIVFEDAQREGRDPLDAAEALLDSLDQAAAPEAEWDDDAPLPGEPAAVDA